MVKSLGSGVRLPRLETEICHLLALLTLSKCASEPSVSGYNKPLLSRLLGGLKKFMREAGLACNNRAHQ